MQVLETSTLKKIFLEISSTNVLPEVPTLLAMAFRSHRG